MRGTFPRMTKFLLQLLFLLYLILPRAEAAIWYAKESATGTGSGTSAANAAARTGIMALASAGDTIIYCDALTGSINYTKNDLKLFGADSSGVTNKFQCTVVGSSGTHAIYGNDGVTGVRIWGFHVLSAYIDGIKIGGDDHQIRDCWVEKAGRGDPAWNTSGSYRGQGIGAHSKQNVIIENCLVENCGAMPGQDHGLYINGTNYVVRGNICRTNIGWGIQCADVTGDCDNVLIEGNLIHDNGYTGYSQSGLTFQTQTAKTNNKIRNNTIVARSGKYAMITYAGSGSSRVTVINNILIGDSGYGILVASTGGTNTVVSDYNLKSAILSGEPQGAHDVQGTPTFDSEANGRYWLANGSAGRGLALASDSPAIDFFGRPQLRVFDVGAFQYEDMLANDDTRNLGDGARDPWVREALNLRVTPSTAAHELRWLEPNLQHTGYYIQRSDSVNNVYDIATFVARGTTYWADPTAAMTNGVTYSYTLTPETTLGNSGGIHSIAVAVICDKFSSIHPARILSYNTNITGFPSPDNAFPNWTNWCDVTVNIPGTNIVATGNGVADTLPALMAAWERCPSNSVIYFPAGNYAFSAPATLALQSLTLNNNKVIRGAGTNLTRFFGQTSSAGWASASTSTLLQIGAFNEQGTERITSGPLPKGSTQVTLPGGYGSVPMVPGTILKFWESDAGGIDGATVGGAADPIYNSNDGSTYAIAGAPLKREVVMITSTPGSGVVNFWPPLMQSFSAGCRVQYQYLYMANRVGIEGIHFDGSVTNISRLVTWEGTSQGWIKNCLFTKVWNAGIRKQFNVQWQMQGNRIDDLVIATANAGIGVQLLRDCTSGLMVNNVFRKSFPAVELQRAINGNFFTGNYYLEPQGGLAPIDNHGGLNRYNCWEREEGYGMVLDGYFGSPLDFVINRCFFHGEQSGFGAKKILNFCRFTRDAIVMNSVLGTISTNWRSEILTNGWNNAYAAILRAGYPNMGNDTWSGNNTTFVPLTIGAVDLGVKSNLYWHANFTHDSNAVSYISGWTNRAMPYSLFTNWNVSSAPWWYGTNSWPGIGTDGGTVATNPTPAKSYYLALGGGGGGGTPMPPNTYAPTNFLNRIYYYFFRGR